MAKKNNWANSKFDVDKLDIDKLKNVPNSLSSLKSKVDKLDIGKFETTPIDLNKRSNVAKKYVLKNTEHNKLVKKADNIKTSDTFDLVKKTITHKIMKLKTKLLLIIILLNILLLKNLIN